MNGFLKQSTAAQVRSIGPFVDSTDFVTLENGLTIANTDIIIKKNGAASAAKNSGGATADGAGGLYHLTWDATDTATVGELSYSVKVAGALVVFGTYTVLEEAIYDALFGAAAAGYQVPIWAAAGSTVNLSATTVSAVGTLTTYTGNTPQTGDSFARIGATGSGLTSLATQASVNTVDGIVDAILIDTAEIGAAGAGLTALGDARIANLDAAVSTRMATYAQPAGFLAATFPSGTIANTTNITAGTLTTVTNLTNLPTIPANWLTATGMDATAGAEIADQVWDELIAGHLGAGSTGAALNAAGSAGDPWTTPLPGAYGAGTAGFIIGTNLDAAITSRAAAATALSTVQWTNGRATNLDNLDALISSRMATFVYTVPPTAVENADALLDRNMATGVDNGSATVRTPRQAFRFLRNKWAIAGATLTVNAEDDVTPSWTATLSTDAAALPVIGNDPAGP